MASDALLCEVLRAAAVSVPARGHDRHQLDVRNYTRNADRPRRAIDRGRHLVRQYFARGDRYDAPVAARALWLDWRPSRAVPQLLAPHRHCRFRPVAVGLPDTSIGADCARIAMDDRSPGNGDATQLGAG